jgi:hypothetical protein
MSLSSYVSYRNNKKKTSKIKASIITAVSFSDGKSAAGKPHGMLENKVMKVQSGVLEQTWNSTTCNKQYLQRVASMARTESDKQSWDSFALFPKRGKKISTPNLQTQSKRIKIHSIPFFHSPSKKKGVSLSLSFRTSVSRLYRPSIFPFSKRNTFSTTCSSSPCP